MCIGLGHRHQIQLSVWKSDSCSREAGPPRHHKPSPSSFFLPFLFTHAILLHFAHHFFCRYACESSITLSMLRSFWHELKRGRKHQQPVVTY